MKQESYSAQERLDLITRRLPEVDGADKILKILADGGTPKGWWATAPTGKPHIAYFVPFIKLAELVNAGCDVTILFCDTYAYCVNYDQPMSIVAARTRCYRYAMCAALESLGVPSGRVHFVDGSSFDLSKEFNLEMYRLSTLVDQQEVKATGAECWDAARLSPMWCPCFSLLAEEYLDADFQFGGLDQRGLMEFNARFQPLLGYRKRAYLRNAMISGLVGPKMSASIPDSKVGLLESAEIVRKRIARANCQDCVLEGNTILLIVKEVLLPASQLRRANQDPPSEKSNKPTNSDLDHALNGHSNNLDQHPNSVHGQSRGANGAESRFNGRSNGLNDDAHDSNNHVDQPSRPEGDAHGRLDGMNGNTSDSGNHLDESKRWENDTNGHWNNTSKCQSANQEKDADHAYQPFNVKDAPEGALFSVKVEKLSGPSFKHYDCYEQIERDFISDDLRSGELKMAVSEAINELLDPIREGYKRNEKWQQAIDLGYANE